MQMKIILIYILLVIIFIVNIPNYPLEAKSVIDESWKELIEQINTNLDNSSNLIEDRFKLAVAYANLGEIEKTMTELDKLKKLNGDKSVSQFIKKYEKFYLLEQENLMVLNYLAFAHYIAEQFDDSKMFFKEITEIDNKHIMGYNYLALVQSTLGDYDEALQTLSNARDIDENKFTHLVYGYIYYHKGQVLKAVWHLGKSGDLGLKILKQI